jgi:splicing factor 3A subunit 3
MRCLGIPNSRHFAEITKIDDAQALWDKLKVSQKVEQFKPETMEEFEDHDGNVFNRRMYEVRSPFCYR